MPFAGYYGPGGDPVEAEDSCQKQFNTMKKGKWQFCCFFFCNKYKPALHELHRFCVMGVEYSYMWQNIACRTVACDRTFSYLQWVKDYVWGIRWLHSWLHHHLFSENTRWIYILSRTKTMGRTLIDLCKCFKVHCVSAHVWLTQAHQQ